MRSMQKRLGLLFLLSTGLLLVFQNCGKGFSTLESELSSIDGNTFRLSADANTFGSPSTKTNYIVELYRTVLNRDAAKVTTDEISHYLSVFSKDPNACLNITREFLQSDEAKKVYASYAQKRDSESFLHYLYGAAFGRIADTEGLNYWKGQLDAGAISMPDLAASFSRETRAIEERCIRRGLQSDNLSYALSWVASSSNPSAAANLLSQQAAASESVQNAVNVILNSAGSTDKKACVLDAKAVAHGDSVVAYSTRSVQVGTACSSVSVSRVCNNGILSGSNSYKYSYCAAENPSSNNQNTAQSKRVSHIQEIYKKSLGRSADTAGLNYYLKEMDTRGAVEGCVVVSTSVLKSSEAKDYYNSAVRFKTSKDFLKYAYQAAFSRNPDSSGEAYWTGEMGNGFTRQQVIENFVTCGDCLKEIRKVCSDAKL